jgi:tRNA modification GTPase
MKTLWTGQDCEKLREGVRVVLGGPPNSGKSTLLNALMTGKLQLKHIAGNYP